MDVRQILTIVMLLVVAPVALAIGAVVTYETTGSIDTESGRTIFPDETLNSDFSDNTGNVPDNWENTVTDNSIATYENVSGNWVASDNVGDNGTCEWYQALTVSDLHDGVSSATILAKYQLSDNHNLENLQIRVVLDDGTDNNVILLVDNTLHVSDNSTWYTVDNDVADYITATGTYYLRLWDNTERGSPAANHISVRWDNASLTVNTYGMGYTENAVADVEGQTATAFSIGSLLPLVIAAVALITVIVVGFYGLVGTGRQRRR